MNAPIAEVFSQGDEVVNGEIADTNAAWLASELVRLGFTVSRHTTVGDHLEALVELLREIAGRADLCLCSGGLGPTCDDLTAEAVSRAFDRPLVLDPEALAQIEQWFERMGRPMAAANRKQALLPEGALRLDNGWGTAPGFGMVVGRCRFYFLPGVPREMQAMFGQSIRPELPRLFALVPRPRVILRTVGLGESILQELLDPIALPAGVQLGFRTGGAENQVKLAFPPSCAAATVEATTAAVAAAIGPAVYAMVRNGAGPVGLAEVVGERLTARGAMLYLAETVSGGAMAACCGGHQWLAGALVEPESSRLLARLGVLPEATAADTATSLAGAIREREAVDYALVQFVDEEPATLGSGPARVEVCCALAGPEGHVVESRSLAGNAQRRRDTAAVFGLDLLRRVLNGLMTP